MNIIYRLGIFIAIAFFSLSAEAGVSKQFKESFVAKFTPAVHHKGLDTAASNLEKEKLRAFVVVEKDNVIPAERAFYVVSPSEYDYRGALVDGDKIKTRYGKFYTYLPKGTVMAIAGVEYSGDRIYLKLISIKNIPSTLFPEKKATRVTVMLGFKFDKQTLKDANMDQVFSTIEAWVKPFQTLEEAINYSEKN